MTTQGNFGRELGNRDLPGRFLKGLNFELSREIMFGFDKLQPTDKIGPFG